MTTGTVTYGNRLTGSYLYRDWSGQDGQHNEEHRYAYAVRESFYSGLDYAFSFLPNMWMSGSMFNFSPMVPQSYVDHTVNLVNCASNKIQTDLLQSEFNAGVFAGEFRETYHMMCAIVTSISRSVGYAKRGRWDKAMNVIATWGKANPRLGTSVAANNYMMWHFGILPMLYDLKHAYEYLVSTYRVVKRVRRHCRFKDSKYLTSNSVTWLWQINAVVEIRGQVECVELNEFDRLGLTDPASIAWELTKLSWLIDWVIPIGNFLSAVNASRKTQGASFFVTRMQKEVLSGPKSNGFYIFRGFDDSCYEKYYGPGAMNSREAYAALPWQFPTIENPLGDSLSRWVTATAFLRQTVGR